MANDTNKLWQFWIDVGGTFTDAIGRDPSQKLHSTKVLSSGDRDGMAAPVVAIRKLMNLARGERIPPVELHLGTTRGTNALLEHKGARVGLMITKGFKDLLEIGTQARPDLFAIDIVKHKTLYEQVIEIEERIDAQGNILTPLNESQIADALETFKQNNIQSVAIAFINSWLNPSHEKRVWELTAEADFSHISSSAELSQTIHFLNRAQTAVLDAYLSPIIGQYIQTLKQQLPDARIKMMTSAGALIDAEHFKGKDSILSGPAGGVVGFAHVAKQCEIGQAIGFDMGGTSTDVSRYAGEYEYQYATKIAGTNITTPMYAIHTVAAGGGSVCYFDGIKFNVGLESAGAIPGPICYGNSGPLSVTDINLYTGRISPTHFPFPLNKQAVVEELEKQAAQVFKDTHQQLTGEQIATGYTKIANQKMAAAIAEVSSAKGYDLKQHALICFGGAGAQHACAIADALQINKIIIHPYAGILSAFGIGMADTTRFYEQTILKPYSDETLESLRDIQENQGGLLTAEILAEGFTREQISRPELLFDLRYAGESSSITIREPSDHDFVAAFERLHQQHYGYTHENTLIEIATVRIEVTAETEKHITPARPTEAHTPEAIDTTQLLVDEKWVAANVYDLTELSAGAMIAGPAVALDPLSTIVIEPNYDAVLTKHGTLEITQAGLLDTVRSVRQDSNETADPIWLELFNNHFQQIATDMGITLQKTSMSVNVKERLDFSCAILNKQGSLVVNAPHIPVHLGAMSDAVKGLLGDGVKVLPGDVFLTNDPGSGGSHLPDLTVITPVFDAEEEELQFIVASRAHHAEIGGTHPGSMYPFAVNLEEEGVVIRNLKIMRRHRFDEALLRETLASGRYPSRAIHENIADIRAAIAANQSGANALRQMIQQHGWDTVYAYMGHIQSAAKQKTMGAISAIADGEYTFTDQLDCGGQITVSITIDHQHMTVDFTGTSAVNTENSLNANPAIVRSAILYCLRCIINENIPLNDGVLEPVTIIIPEGSLLWPATVGSPAERAAVVGGNVEVSQRIVDVIFGALGVAAASQGTMNNFTFGNSRFGYYETICGGSGASSKANGASAVHTHMTNTRLTDVEVLEHNCPARVDLFQIRTNSGGRGLYRGGDGIIRQITALETLNASLLTQRRMYRPYGMNGGEPGLPGMNTLITGDGEWTELGPLAQCTLKAGDAIRIETPGGGGYGEA